MPLTTKRVRRSRRKGAIMPPGAIYVGRPTKWGNPFTATTPKRAGHGSHARCTILHKEWLAGRVGALMLENMGFHPGEIDALERLRCRVLSDLHQLAGKDLACWCPLTSEWCHAETLMRLAPQFAEIESIAA